MAYGARRDPAAKWLAWPVCVQRYFCHHGEADSFAAPQESQPQLGYSLTGPLPGKPLKPRRFAGLDRRARRVEHHPNQRVVAHQADAVEEGALAELRDRTGIGGVADAVVLQQLRAEVIQRFLILRHAVRPATVADRLGDLRIEATLDRERIMRGPLVRLRPLPRSNENDELGEPRGQGAVEA